MMWQSPLTQTMMEVVLLEGLRVYHDPQSGGYWLEKGELETIAQHHHAHLSTQALEIGETVQRHHGRSCPKDSVDLVEYEFGKHSGIKLDICPTCGGIWLDAGELEKVIWYLDAHSDYAHGIAERQYHPSLRDRVLAFLYALAGHPPMY